MIILHIISSLGPGGAEKSLFNLIKGTPDSQHIVVCLGSRSYYSPLLLRFSNTLTVVHLRISSILSFFQSLHILRTLYLRYQPDLIYSWMYHANFITLFLRLFPNTVPIIWGIRHADIHINSTKLATLLIIIACAPLSYFVPSLIIANSLHACRTHRRLGYKRSLFRFLPNGVDITLFHPPKHRQHSSRHSDIVCSAQSPILVNIARFDPYKDHLTLLEALSYVRTQGFEFLLLLIGNGCDYSNLTLKDYIASAGLTDKVILLGKQSSIPSILRHCDLFVLSSLGESFPNVLLEAMASGVPCVSTDVGDCSNILKSSGWLSPTSNPSKLAAHIQTALTEMTYSPYTWHQRRLYVRQLACTYSLPQHFAKYNSLFNTLLKHIP